MCYNIDTLHCETKFGEAYFVILACLPEIERLMHASSPAHLDLASRRMNTTVPMKPRTPQKTPMEDKILVSSNQTVLKSK